MPLTGSIVNAVAIFVGCLLYTSHLQYICLSSIQYADMFTNIDQKIDSMGAFWHKLIGGGGVQFTIIVLDYLN